MKIGVLLPKSTTHPFLGYDFYLALQQSVQYLEQEVEWQSASIGFGTDENDILSKAEDLILNKQIDVLVAFADYPKILCLATLLEMTGINVFVVNNGAKLPEDWSRYSNFFFLSLQESLLSYMTGKEVVKNGLQKGIIASNYYDAGYAPCQMMTDAFMQNKGDIVFNFIPHTIKPVFEMNMIDAFMQNNPSSTALLCTYSSPLTKVFWEQWNLLSHSSQLAIYGSSTFLMESIKDFKEETIKASCKGFLAWDKSIDEVVNATYIKKFEEKHKRTATCFGALGWDLGIVLHHIMVHNDDEFDGLQLTRGESAYDRENQVIISPAYFANCTNDTISLEKIDQKEMLSNWSDFKSTYSTPNQAGWINTYLCS